MKPFFSIIIPVYNVQAYIRDCLNSVFAQTYINYEVICVNDGSTDDSLHILQEYQDKHNNLVIIDSPNGGTASARNLGIKAAKGEYLWFVDSDDWIELNSLEVIFRIIKNGNLDILCFNGKLKYEKDGSEKQDKGFKETRLSGWDYYCKYALKPSLFHFVCVVLRVYRREFIIENDLYFQTGILHEDNLWIPFVMHKAKSVEVIPDSLYIYRIWEGSKMQNMSIKQIQDIFKVNNVLLYYFVDQRCINKKTVYRMMTITYVDTFNMLHDMQYEDKMEQFYFDVPWPVFREIIVDLDILILYYLLLNRRWKSFLYLYHLDFYVIRKIVKKIWH